MVKGLPDRPLSHPEVASLNQSDSIGFVFPATPHSIRDDGELDPEDVECDEQARSVIRAILENEGMD
jgi:hypothetical protein